VATEVALICKACQGFQNAKAADNHDDQNLGTLLIDGCQHYPWTTIGERIPARQNMIVVEDLGPIGLLQRTSPGHTHISPGFVQPTSPPLEPRTQLQLSEGPRGLPGEIAVVGGRLSPRPS